MGDFRLRLHSKEFRLLRDLFLEAAGLHFDESSRNAFERRLGERVIELGFSDFSQYYKYLRFESRATPELANALELITTAETYFMRQEYQLESFVAECLPELYERNAQSKRIAIWSAGCSTGEEVYTLAMLLHGAGLFSDWNIKVIGSDLSRTRVAQARRGVYRENSFRSTSDSVRATYFESVEPDESKFPVPTWRVCDEIRQMCHFAQLNLLDTLATASIGRVDIVFCRNVLIYFGTKARSQVIDNLHRRLVPGGYLFLGHSESLLNVSTAFELVHLSQDLVYRKPVSSIRF